MLKTNVIGSLLVCIILFSIIGYFFSLGININWYAYAKVLGIIAAIAAITSIASYGRSNS